MENWQWVIQCRCICWQTNLLNKLDLDKSDDFLISVFMGVINRAPSSENSLPRSKITNSRWSQGTYSTTGHWTVLKCHYHLGDPFYSALMQHLSLPVWLQHLKTYAKKEIKQSYFFTNQRKSYLKGEDEHIEWENAKKAHCWGERGATKFR